jgi:P27 family predicted phage terminase small subunit
MASPYPLPTAVKEQRGTIRPVRVNKDEPKPTAVRTTPTAPPAIKADPKALKHWKKISRNLTSMKVLTVPDLEALALLCESLSQWETAVEAIQREGHVITTPNGFPAPSPWIGIRNQASDRAMKYLIQFGLTPSARTRVASVPEAAADPVKAILGLVA